MIDVKNLEKSFGDHFVLKGINEHINKGEKVAVKMCIRDRGRGSLCIWLSLLRLPTGI